MADQNCWMYLGNRTTFEYVNGLESFLEVAHRDMSNRMEISQQCDVHAMIVRIKSSSRICRKPMLIY